MFRAVSEDTKNKLQTDNDFETVGVYKTFGNIVNSDGRTDLAYMDDSAMSFLGFELMDGNLPQSNTEVLVSETYLSIHKLVLGDSFSFEYVDTLTNELKENTFTVCGIIQNKTQEKGKQFYMLISSAIVRKREFALLQAVGMTNQQLRKMLYREGMSISVKSAILATFFGVTVGALLCYLANKVLALKFILFEFNIFPVLLFSILLVGLQICISYGVSRSIEKDTLVERLRTE